jgi:hypothetical protein
MTELQKALENCRLAMQDLRQAILDTAFGRFLYWVLDRVSGR